MSATSTNNIPTCANCGKSGEGDDAIQLKSCAACKLVKYCSRECQIAHRPQHKKECKKIVAEHISSLLESMNLYCNSNIEESPTILSEDIFKQPPPNEDCPICFLQLPTLETGCKYMVCCGKVICSGCTFANSKLTDDEKCSFCRTPAPRTDEIMLEMIMHRISVGDAEAIFNLGCWYDKGLYRLPKGIRALA